MFISSKGQKHNRAKLKRPYTTKPDVIVCSRWAIGGAAIGATREVGGAIPVTAPYNTEASRCRPARIGSSRKRRRRIPIPTPRSHIPRHVVKSITRSEEHTSELQ